MLNDLKDLEKAIKLCRRLGVQSIRIGDVEFHLGTISHQVGTGTDKGSKRSTTGMQTSLPLGEITEHTKIEVDGELSPEQLLFYSAEPVLDTIGN